MRMLAFTLFAALSSTVHAQGIVAVVNGTPITGYQLQQRRDLLVLETDILDRARQHYDAWSKSPDLKKQLMAIHRAMTAGASHKPRKVQKAIFKERVDTLGKEMVAKSIDGARKDTAGDLEKRALDELIEDRIKLDEATRLGVITSVEEVRAQMAALPAKKKRDEDDQFGIAIDKIQAESTGLFDQVMADLSWRNVVKRISCREPLTGRPDPAAETRYEQLRKSASIEYR